MKTLGRFCTGLGALVLLVATLVGLPWLLVRIGYLPDPRSWSWSGFLALWTTPDNGRVLLTLITLIGWVAWAVIAVSILAELVTLASRQRIRLRIPGLRGVQGVAAVLLLAVVGMLADQVQQAVQPTVPHHPVDPQTSHERTVTSASAGPATPAPGRAAGELPAPAAGPGVAD